MPLAIPLIVLLAALVAMGMATLQRPVSGGFVKWAANLLGNIPIVGGIFSVEQILKLDRWVTHALGNAFKAVEGGAVKWFAELAHYVYVTGYWSLYWPIALVHEVKHLTTVTIPRMIRAKTDPLDRRVDIAEAEAKAAVGKAHGVTKYVTTQPNTKTIIRVQRVAMPHAREWDWIHKHWKSLTVAVLGAAALPGAIDLPHAPSLPIPFGRTVKQLRRRLTRVEALLGVTAFAAVLARVLRIPSPACLTRGPIGKVARALCRMPLHWVDDLIGLIADFFILENICAILPWLEDGVSLVATPLVEALTVAGAGLCSPDAKAPPKLKVPTLHLPGVAFTQLYLP